jgi:hypothetical protein
MGLWEAQYAKIHSTPTLKNIPLRIIHKHEMKIIELIRHIIFTNAFIPKSITIYEDRPEIFIKFAPFFKHLFNCEIKVIKVLLYDNIEYELWEEQIF